MFILVHVAKAALPSPKKPAPPPPTEKQKHECERVNITEMKHMSFLMKYIIESVDTITQAVLNEFR
jgi:hypothetical protein